MKLQNYKIMKKYTTENCFFLKKALKHRSRAFLT